MLCGSVWHMPSGQLSLYQYPSPGAVLDKNNMGGEVGVYRLHLSLQKYGSPINVFITSPPDHVSKFCWLGKCQHSLAPPYMTDQLQQVARMEPRQRLGLESSSSPALVIPATRRSSLGDRAFLVAAARAWNSLPSTVTAGLTLHSFRQALKTHLFTASFLPS